MGQLHMPCGSRARSFLMSKSLRLQCLERQQLSAPMAAVGSCHIYIYVYIYMYIYIQYTPHMQFVKSSVWQYVLMLLVTSCNNMTGHGKIIRYRLCFFLPAVPSSCSSTLNASLASTGSSVANHCSRRGQDQLLDDIGARILVASLSSGVSCPCGSARTKAQGWNAATQSVSKLNGQFPSDDSMMPGVLNFTNNKIDQNI